MRWRQITKLIKPEPDLDIYKKKDYKIEALKDSVVYARKVVED